LSDFNQTEEIMRAAGICRLSFFAALSATSLSAGNVMALVWGDYSSTGYNAARDNPFQQDSSFLGAGFDLSGVGVVNGGGWATMISDQYFLSAYHAEPTNGGNQSLQVDFFRDFKDTTPDESAWIDPTFRMRLGTTDLWVGKLLSTPSAAIKRYPLISRNESSNYLAAVDPKIYIVGYFGGDQTVTRTRVGVNKITGLIGPDYEFNLEAGATAYGGDAAMTIFGDSTGPTFVRTSYGTNGGRQGIALAGIHHASGADSSVSTHVGELTSIPGINPTVVTDLPGDFNDDWKVDIKDLGIFCANWGMGTGKKTFAQGDANGDGYLNGLDVGIFAANWNRTLSAPLLDANASTIGGAQIPEPATLMLLVWTGIACLGMRHRRK
jgi:hypothetical protein